MTRLIDIVSSRVKAEVLRLLFGLPGIELHLRELVRQSGLSLSTVQQELQHLTRAGLVAARKDGNRVCYRANPEHPAYTDLRSLVLKTDGLPGALRPAVDVPEDSPRVHLGFGRSRRRGPGQRRLLRPTKSTAKISSRPNLSLSSFIKSAAVPALVIMLRSESSVVSEEAL